MHIMTKKVLSSQRGGPCVVAVPGQCVPCNEKSRVHLTFPRLHSTQQRSAFPFPLTSQFCMLIQTLLGKYACRQRMKTAGRHFTQTAFIRSKVSTCVSFSCRPLLNTNKQTPGKAWLQRHQIMSWLVTHALKCSCLRLTEHKLKRKLFTHTKKKIKTSQMCNDILCYLQQSTTVSSIY